MEDSNSDEPLYNVEQGLKISHFSVYNQAQNNLQMSLKYYARKRHTREVKKQVQKGSLKQ